MRGPQSGSGRQRDWRIPVRDMIGFCERTLRLADGMERAAFFADKTRCDAAILSMQRIGEAATRIHREIRDANPQIPWRDIISARNHITHEYDRINENVVWATIQIGIPDLLPKLRELVESE